MSSILRSMKISTERNTYRTQYLAHRNAAEEWTPSDIILFPVRGASKSSGRSKIVSITSIFHGLVFCTLTSGICLIS